MQDPNVTGPANAEDSRINAAIDGLKSGQPLKLDEQPDNVITHEDLEEVEISPNSGLGDNEPEVEVEASETAEDSSISEPELTEITITDHKGRRNIKVDLTDKDRMIRAVKREAGMRKFQAERDQARAKLAEYESFAEKAKHFDSLEDAYNKEGVAGIIDRVLGEGSHEAYIQQAVEKSNMRAVATPEELAALDAQDKSSKLERQIEALRASAKKAEENAAKNAEKVERDKLQSLINPTFEKYRFEGKLNDRVREHELDQMIWQNALAKLERLDNQGVEITKAVINKQFKSVANVIRKTINDQSNKKTDKIIDNKISSATKNAQVSTKKGMNKAAVNSDAFASLKKGDVHSFFKQYKGKLTF